jgi:hypothetical protein
MRAWERASTAGRNRRTPWQNQCAVVPVARSVYIGFGFNLEGVRITANWRYATSEQIALFRAGVAADGSGCPLQDLVSSLAADGHEIAGDVMKRIPRGHPRDHPRADLLRDRSLSAACEFEPEADPVVMTSRYRNRSSAGSAAFSEPDRNGAISSARKPNPADATAVCTVPTRRTEATLSASTSSRTVSPRSRTRRS